MGGGGGLGKLITVAAIVYTGGSAAGLWGAEAAAGAGLMEGAELAAAAAEGGGADFLFSQAAGYNGLAGAGGAAAAGSWITDPSTGLETWSGDAAETGLDTGLTELGEGQFSFPDWASENIGVSDSISEVAKEAAGSFNSFSDPTAASNLNSITGGSPTSIESQLSMPGADSLGVDTSLQGGSGLPEASGGDLSTLGNAPAQAPTSTLEGITSGGENMGQGISPTGGNATFNPQKYTYENKDFFTGKNGTGMNVDVSSNQVFNPELANDIPGGTFKQGLEMNNLPDMYKRATTPLWNGGNNVIKAPSPLSLGVRGLGSIDSYLRGKEAQGLLQSQMDRMRGAEDSNAARGQFANQEWQSTQSDPMHGYSTFMQGAGRDFVNQARAAAAKSGSRGGYVNSGRMQSDLASLWQKNQTQRAGSIAGGFNKDPYSSSSSMMPGYANLVKNQNAPLFQGIQGAVDGYKLADLFGSGE